MTKVSHIKSPHIINKYLHLLILLLSFFVFNSVKAQNFSFKNYSINNGLPSNETYQIKQDKKGYIWIVTDRGIVKYNGNKFKIYGTKENIPEPVVFGMLETPDSTMWFHGWHNIVFSLKNEKFNLTKKDSTPLATHYHGLMARLTYSDSQVYCLGAKRAFLKVNPKNRQQTYCEIEDTLKDIFRIKTTKNGILYYVPYLQSTISKYSITLNDTIIGTATNPSYNSFLTKKPSRVIRYDAIQSKNKKNIYILSGWQLIKISDKKITQTVNLKSSGTYSLFEDDKSNIWIGIDRGGCFMFPKGDLNATPIHLLTNYTVTSVMQDVEGHLWFSTAEAGIFYLQSRQIENIIVEPNTNESVTNCLTVDSKQNIYAGLISGAAIKITKEGGKYNTTKVLQCISPISEIKHVNDTLYSLAKDLFINTSKFITSGKTFFISTNKNKLLLISGYGGTRVYKNGIFTDTILEGGEYVRVTVPWEKGLFLAGTFSGLFIIDIAQGEMNRFSNNPLLKTRITDLVVRGKRIYISTLEKGLLIYEKDSIYQFTEADGLTNNLINTLAINTSGDLFMGTPTGVCYGKFINNSFVIKGEWNTDDGLISNHINDIEVSDSTIYLATNKGVSKINYLQYTTSSISPKIYLSKLTINAADTCLNCAIKLPYGKHNIKVDFEAISFSNSLRKNYKYRILPKDTTWQYTSTPKIEFINLESGAYTVEISASNRNGVWSATPATLHFTIDLPYWKKWWFIALSILTILIVIGFFIYLRKQYIAQKNRQKNLEKTIAQTIEHDEKTTIEKEKIEQELELKKREAIALAINISRKASIIDSIKGSIVSDADSEEIKTKALKLINKEKDGNVDWTLFNERFTTLHPTFLVGLRKAFPKLSPAEIRLCMFIKLEMSSREIATMQNIELDSVTKARYRLKKKFKLQRAISIESYIMNF